MASSIFLFDLVKKFDIDLIVKHFILIVLYIFLLQHLHDLDIAILIHVLAAISTSGSNLFVYCYFGKLATDSYTRMAECLYDNDWVGIDIESQKFIILMIANIQKPIYYHGFGVIYLNLETFTDVSVEDIFWHSVVTF